MGFNAHKDSNYRLHIALILNFLITLSEVIGGLLSGSLALLSDALHNFGDTLALLMAGIAIRIGRKAPTPKQTFGFRRAEILAALFNTVFLLVISFFLIEVAIERFADPPPIKGPLMMAVALVGLAGNLISVVLLHRHKEGNLNIKAAYLHLMGDTLSSVAVVGSSIAIRYLAVYWLDAAITLLVSGFIIYHAVGIFRKTLTILMQAAPAHIDLQELSSSLQPISSVKNIHHVHVWSLSDDQIFLECHIELTEDLEVSKIEKLQKELETIFYRQFGITHLTCQYEHGWCANQEIIHPV